MLLLDEPLSALDAATRGAVPRAARLRARRPAGDRRHPLFDDAASLADRVAVLVGALVARPARRAAGGAADAFVASFTGANELPHGHCRGNTPVRLDPRRGRSNHRSRGRAVVAVLIAP